MALTKVGAGVLNIDDLYGFRNRIINGDMKIDQRNAGAPRTGLTGAAYVVDRWSSFHNYGTVTTQQSTTAPTDFVSSLYTTVTSTASASAASLYTIIQSVEGNNLTDLSWGTANAKTITVSFQVRSNVTGTYGVFIRNGAANRYYVSTFSISSANTWEEKTITIPGDTSGTWLTTTGVGLTLGVVLGAGADRHGTANTWVSGSSSGPFTTPSQVDWMSNSGATFFITGVQLEKGTVATPFERRPFGTELALCQRYFQKSYEASIIPGTVVAADAKSLINAAWGYAGAINVIGNGNASFQANMRTSATIVIYDKAGNSGRMSTQNNNGEYTDNVTPNQILASESHVCVQKYAQSCAGIAFAYTASAEL